MKEKTVLLVGALALTCFVLPGPKNNFRLTGDTPGKQLAVLPKKDKLEHPDEENDDSYSARFRKRKDKHRPPSDVWHGRRQVYQY